MITNNEFKGLRHYKLIVSQSEKNNIFDRFSIMRNLINNVTNRQLLLDSLEYDLDKWNYFVENVTDCEIESEYTVLIGNNNTKTYIVFDVDDDGKFIFKGIKRPLQYGGGKVM